LSGIPLKRIWLLAGRPKKGQPVFQPLASVELFIPKHADVIQTSVIPVASDGIPAQVFSLFDGENSFLHQFFSFAFS